jgi:flagellar biogenesis protein FliO
MFKILFAFFIALLIVLALIGVTIWLVRQFRANRLGGDGARRRQPQRLTVIDAARVDGSRSVVLIRRDNIEHLLMIGGATDVVIEANIMRTTGASESARPLPPERGRLAAELSRLPSPEVPMPPPHSAASRVSAPTLSPSAEPLASPQIVHNLSELTRQLEAALSRSPAPQGRPPVTDPLAVPPSASPTVARPDAPILEFEPRSKRGFDAKAEAKSEPKIEPKFEPPKPEAESKLEPKPEPKAEHELEQSQEPQPPESQPKGEPAEPTGKKTSDIL